MLIQTPKKQDDAWLDVIEQKMAEDGYIDLDDPEQRRVFLKDRTHFKYRENKASPEAKAKAATDNKQALSNLETGKAKLTLPNTRQQAIEKAALISKGVEFVSKVEFQAKPLASEPKPKAKTTNKPKTPSKPLETEKATNAPKAPLKAPERKIKAQNKPFASEGLSVKEKQGLLLERAWLKFKLGGMDLDVLVVEISSIKKAMLVDAYLSFEAIATANNTTVEEIIKAGKRHG